MKNHVILKTGAISFVVTGLNYILKYITIENSYFKLQYLEVCIY